MTQLIPPLVNDNAYARLVVAKKIIGFTWIFPVGMKLDGIKCHGRTWRVWPRGQEHAFIVGVPRRYVKLDKKALTPCPAQS
jgi:hypothetical protein